MKKLIKKLQLNNKGAAMVSVVIVAAFITILASTMLYFTSMNYQMKSTGYQNNRSFYKAEEALDVIKSVLVKDVSAAYEKAYKATMVEYAAFDPTTRQSEFQKVFIDELETLWTGRAASAGSYEEAIKALIDSDTGVDATLKSDAKGCIYVDPVAPAVGISKIESEGKFIIENVKVNYTQNGYTSYINTDICLVAPDYDFTLEASSASYVAPADPADAERKTVNMSEHVIFMNWTRY